MSRRLLRCVVPLGAMALATAARAQAPALPSSARLLDGFETTAGWSAHPSGDVSLVISADSSGTHGHAMRLDFDFHGWGMHRFEKAARTFTSPELGRLLAEVAGG